MSNGCEPNEVIIAGLPPGSAFEVVLSHTTSVYGIVRKQLAGSTLVDTVTNQNEHVQFECPVIHHKEVTDSEEWLTKIKGESRMAKEKKVKAEKAAKIPKELGLLVTRYEATSKKHESFMNEEKKSFAALAYRAIVKDGPITFDEIWSAIYRSVTAGTEGKTPKNTVRAALSVLAKNGFVKYIKTREVAKAVAA